MSEKGPNLWATQDVAPEATTVSPSAAGEMWASVPSHRPPQPGQCAPGHQLLNAGNQPSVASPWRRVAGTTRGNEQG